MPRGDGLQKHRVKLDVTITLDIYDNWTPEEVVDLIGGTLQNWSYYSTSNLSMETNSAEVISEEEVKNA